jgi:HAD superfamily hydrolase (TIGR01509 family)
MVKAIFWDNDGVLVNTEHLYFRATARVLASVGVELDVDRFRTLFLTESRGAWHLAEQIGVTPDKVDSLREERNRIYKEMIRTENVAIDGVEGVLHDLKPFYTMGVVTSSHREDFELIHRSTDFVRFFDFVLAREDYRLSKPNPEPYLRAMQIVGLQPADVLAIEDSERGMIAAKQAGLQCWVIPTSLTEKGDFSSADKVLTHIGEVASFLLRR